MIAVFSNARRRRIGNMLAKVVWIALVAALLVVILLGFSRRGSPDEQSCHPTYNSANCVQDRLTARQK
jgi:hypothetical protein